MRNRIGRKAAARHRLPLPLVLALLASPLGLARAGTVSLTASDASGTNSFTAAGHWSDGQPPSAANDYFTAGYLLRTPATGTSNLFLGSSLSLDGNAANAVVGLSLKYPAAGAVRVDNLKLNGGAIFNGVGSTMSVYGNITVLANSFLDPQASGRVLAIYAPISGASATTLGCRAQAGSAGGTVQLLGDNSGYAGSWYLWGTGDSVPGAYLQVGNGGTAGNLGSGNVTNNSSLIFNRSDNLNVANFITGRGNVVLAGPGRVTLNAANAYTGATLINTGTLALGPGASIASSPTLSLAAGAGLDVSAVSAFALASGQTLAGGGTVTGSIASTVGATLSPGDTASGTLTVNGNAALGACALRCDLSTPGVMGGANDLLVVNGDLTLNPGITVNLVFPGGNPVAGTYTLCQCTGTLSGAPANLTASGLGTNSATFALNTATSPRTVTVTISSSGTSPATNSWQLIKIFLQGGQSNSDGRAVTNGLPPALLQPQSDVPFYYYLTGGTANGDGTLGTLTTLRPGCSAIGGGTTFGPELTFGRALADYFALTNRAPATNVTVAIIKYAHGGTSLATNWKANGNSTTNGEGADYVIFQRVVSAGLARLAAAYPGATLELDGMIWVQGESDIDSGATTSAAYGTNLVNFVNDLRLTYAARPPYGTNLPFVFSRISSNQTYYSLPSAGSYASYLVLRSSQAYAAGALTNAFMLDIDGPQFTTLTPYSSPGLHFDTAGERALGAAFGQALIRALPLSRLTPPASTTNGWHLSFSGVAGTRHTLERAAAVTGPWETLTNLLLAPSGSAGYDDTNLPGGAFYRCSRP